MLIQEINIVGRWRVIICYGSDDLTTVAALLDAIGELQSHIRQAIRVLERNNTGYTYSDMGKRISVVVISDATSKGQQVNTIAHEFKHLQSHICEYYGVSEKSEDAAYLVGYLAQQIFGFLKL